MNCFKATRQDGRDFYSGTIDYAAACGTGEVIRHPGALIDRVTGITVRPRKLVRDDPGTYISVSVSEADCTGFTWPGRLFRVEPVGRVMGGGKVPLKASPNKRAVSALRVIEELPAWRLFGPNGQDVVAIIERCATLTADEVGRLAAAWDARDAAWDAAWDAARDAAWDAARAVLARDLISAEHFDLLHGPWRSVVETAP